MSSDKEIFKEAFNVFNSMRDTGENTDVLIRLRIYLMMMLLCYGFDDQSQAMDFIISYPTIQG